MPATLGNDHQVAGLEGPRHLAILSQHRQFALASKDVEYLVAVLVQLPGRSAREAGDPAAAAVKVELADGTIGRSVEPSEIHRSHRLHRSSAQIVNDHLIPLGLLGPGQAFCLTTPIQASRAFCFNANGATPRA